MKKIAIAAGLAMSLAFTTPVFATFTFPWHNDTPKIEITNSGTSVHTLDVTVANTGLNHTSDQPHVSFGWWGSNNTSPSVTTGDAIATSDITTIANRTSVGCGCSSDISISNTGTHVGTFDVTLANTGINHTDAGKVITGGALAGSIVATEVNTTLVGSISD